MASCFSDGRIVRTTKVKHPRGYLAAYQNLVKSYLDTETLVEAEDRLFEYFMNRFRLIEACPKAEFVERTGLTLTVIEAQIQTAIDQEYLTETESHWHITQKGKLFLMTWWRCL